MIKEITKYISDETDLVVGTDIYAGFADIEANDCSIVMESGGLPDFFLTDKLAKTVQILSRGKDYHEAKAQADLIYSAIHGKAGITLPVVDAAYTANVIEALVAPQSLGQDEKGRFQFSTNYVFRIKDATT